MIRRLFRWFRRFLPGKRRQVFSVWDCSIDEDGTVKWVNTENVYVRDKG